MEWYYVVGLVMLFVATVVVLVYLAKQGKLEKNTMQTISGIAGGLGVITESLAKTQSNPVFGIANMITMFVDKAVLAAENAWYNDEIDKEQRKNYCVIKLNELMEAYGVELSDEQWNAVDTLIAAACESMGHYGKESKEEDMEVVVV